VGASDNFYSNALSLGIKIEDIDFVVLSHGHQDHTGGLEQFIKVNHRAKIIMSVHAKDKTFFSYRLKSKRDISMNHSIVKENINRFIFINSNNQISANVGLICQIPLIYETPKANNKLFQSGSNGEKSDGFNHEVALAINTQHGMIVFSGCSHRGILNILETCSTHYNTPVIACVGGTHLIDSDSINEYESESEINDIGKSIIHRYPNMRLYTGHCTGTNAQKYLSKMMGTNFETFHSGAILEL